MSEPSPGRRQELVLAAFELVAERGFEGLRTRDVAARVGVNVATLHYYFPSKEALIRGVLEHAMSRFRTTLAPHGSSADQMRNHLRAVRDLLTKEPEIGSVMAEFALRSARDEAVRGIMREMFDSWHRMVRGLLQRAARDGQLPPEVDIDGAAALVIAGLTAMTMPTLAGTPMAPKALRQLERWLTPRASQATD